MKVKSSLRVPWTAKRSNQSILKEINPKYSSEGLILKLKLQILWPRDAKSWLIGKDPDAGKDWGQEEKGAAEDEMVGWHHQLDGHEFKQTPRDGVGQGSLKCCNPWSHRESDMTEWPNNDSNNWYHMAPRKKQIAWDWRRHLGTHGCSDPVTVRKKQLSVAGQQNGSHPLWNGFHVKSLP